jgi:aminoglycoside/choline kinase family phosphotransferase
MPIDVKETDVTNRDHAHLTALIESQIGRSPSQYEQIAAGLGTRRFYRIRFSAGTPETMIARIEDDGTAPLNRVGDAEPLVPDAPSWLTEPALEPIRTVLETAGIRVPASYACQVSPGIDILEDVGECTLADLEGPERIRAYKEACDVIPRLQSVSGDPKNVPAFERCFDRSLIETKVWKWLYWTIPLLLNRKATAQEVDDCQHLFSRIADLVEDAPQRLSHRDYKAENLHCLPEVTSAKHRASSPSATHERLVLIDVQGAFMAPPEYDLVCLLCDLQVDLDEEFILHAFEDWLPQLPNPPDSAEARVRFNALAVARLCKDISHVVYAGRVGHDLRRWHEIPRGLSLLARATERLASGMPEATPLISLIQELTPAAQPADSPVRG